MIEVIHVSKSFEEKVVLRDVTLQIAGTVAIMAPSGEGKTTLFRILMGLVAPDSGEVRTKGAKIGAVFQEDRLIEHMTAVQNLALAAPAKKKQALLEIAELARAMEAEANIETLILAKGFEQCVAVINGDTCSVVVKAEALQENQIAQINEIVYEQSGILPTNIRIVTK